MGFLGSMHKWRLRGYQAADAPIFSLGALVLSGFAPADDHAMRDKLMGEWQPSDASGTESSWTLKTSGDSIHVSNFGGGQNVAEFDCNTVGKECQIKLSGHKAQVTMYFNGSKLVELETTGSQIVKRRFTATGVGDTMELVTIPIVPGGTSTTTHFKRVSSDISTK